MIPELCLGPHLGGLLEGVDLEALPPALLREARRARVRLSMPVEYSPKAPLENSPLRFGSVTAITTGRDDCGEIVEIEVDDGLKRFGGGAVAQAVG